MKRLILILLAVCSGTVFAQNAQIVIKYFIVGDNCKMSACLAGAHADTSECISELLIGSDNYDAAEQKFSDICNSRSSSFDHSIMLSKCQCLPDKITNSPHDNMKTVSYVNCNSAHMFERIYSGNTATLLKEQKLGACPALK